jgi:hypothetical protein
LERATSVLVSALVNVMLKGLTAVEIVLMMMEANWPVAESMAMTVVHWVVAVVPGSMVLELVLTVPAVFAAVAVVAAVPDAWQK